MAEIASEALDQEIDIRIVNGAEILRIVDKFIAGTVGREIISSNEAINFALDVRLALDEPTEG